MSSTPNSTPGLDTSGWNGDLAVAPLYHYPLPKVELVAGPTVGTFFQLGRVKNNFMSETIRAYGWTIGANAGAFVPLHDRKSLGVLFNFIVHEPLKACTDAGTEMSLSSGLSSVKMKMIGISLAALLCSRERGAGGRSGPVIVASVARIALRAGSLRERVAVTVVQ